VRVRVHYYVLVRYSVTVHLYVYVSVGIHTSVIREGKSMRVLVTGAAGWSGSAVVGALLEAGHAVVAHDLARSWEAERERASSENGKERFKHLR
jgi:hypothetical protein